MIVTFWGTRGSIPTPLSSAAITAKIRQALAGAHGYDLSNPDVIDRYISQLPLTIRGTIGGNTACLHLRSGEKSLILDAGSGIRELGAEMVQKGAGYGPQQIHILITHTHWDHIQGFPFFAPAFSRANQITFHSPIADLRERITRQQQTAFFPIPLQGMHARINFETLTEGEWTAIAGFRILPFRLLHPGTSYGYRIEDEDTCMVYATDSEYKRLDPASTEVFVHYFKDADLLVFDAQYTLTEALDKQDWGHSSAIVGAEFSRRANVKRLALFHHDPASTDEKIWSTKEHAEAYLNRLPNSTHTCEVLVAHDGLRVVL